MSPIFHGRMDQLWMVNLCGVIKLYNYTLQMVKPFLLRQANGARTGSVPLQ